MSAVGQIPLHRDDITAAWLSTALGTEVTSCGVERIGVGTGVLGQIYRATPVYADPAGRPPSLVLKIPAEGEASRFLANALHMGQREVRSYDRFAGRTPLTMPALHFATYDEETGAFALVIEDLGDRRMVDQLEGCSAADAAVVVDALAAHHAMFWGLAGLDHDDWVGAVADPPNPEALAAALRNSWPVIDREFSDLLPASIHDVARDIPDHLPDLMGALSGSPATLLHGDVRLDNLYFATSDQHAPVVAADWQLVMTGQGAYDLAYFLPQNLAPSLGPAAIVDLLHRYHARLLEHGVRDYSYDELFDDFRRAVLFHLCYPLTAGSMDLANDRAVALLRSMLQRAVTAVEAFDAVDFA